MTAGSRRDDEYKPEDALDRAIDETLGATMRAHTVNLRERVLARLDEPADAPAAWRRFVLRPALLPVAGTALLILGVAFTWRHVDDTLARIGSRQPIAGSPSATLPFDSGASGPRSGHPEQSRGVKGRPTTVLKGRPTTVVRAASLLEMDAMSTPATVAADTVLLGDDAEPAPVLPGAVGGDLGDPIKPMPPLRPIVIQPIVSAPIVVAPPVSTLAPAIETIPTVGDLTRDPSDPAKPGGVRQ